MISASTIASGSSAGFSGVGSASTPQSSYTPSSGKPTSGNPSGNPLKDLIETEKEYLDTLKIITTQIAPIWSNDQRSTDFTELLKHAQDIYKINKRFCTRLIKISSSPQGIRELGDTLMHWINDMEAPYANYSRSFISNLNDRQDIVRRPAVKAALYALSVQHSYEITMESLVNAPIQRMLYYKILYSRLLETTEPGRSDHQLLTQANQRIDTIMLMAKKNTARAMTSPIPSQATSPPVRLKSLPNVPHIQTTFSPQYSPMQAPNAQSAILDLEKKIDPTSAVDVFSREPKMCRLQLSTAPRTLILHDSFTLFPASRNGIPPVSTHIFLLSDVLIVTRRLSNEEIDMSRRAGNDYMYSLVFPPLALKHVQFHQLMPERESLGEFFLLVAIRNTDCMHLRTDSKEVKAMWLDKTSARHQNLPPQPAPNYPLPAPGLPPIQKLMNTKPPSPPHQARGTNSPATSPDHNRDTIFDMYSSIGNDNWEREEKDKAPSRDTIFGMYADNNDPEPLPSVPAKGSALSIPSSGAVAAVTHEFIKPAMSHTIESIDISSPVNSPTKDNFFELPKMDKLTLDDSFSNLSTSPPSTAASSIQYGRRSNEPESPLPTSPGIQIASAAAPLSQSVTNGYIPPPTVHNMELAVSEVSHQPLLSQPVEVDHIVAPIPMQAAVQNGAHLPPPPMNLSASKSAPTTHLGPQQILPPVPSPEPPFTNSAPSAGTLLMNGGPAGTAPPNMRPRPPPNFGGPNFRPPPGQMGPQYSSSPPPGPMYGARPPAPGMMARPPYPPNQRPMGQPPYPMSPPVPSKSMGHRPPPLAMQPRPSMPPGARPMMPPQDPALRRSPTHGPPGVHGGMALPGMPSQDGYSFLNVPYNGSPMSSPRSPTTAAAMASVRDIIHRSPPCEVFRWKDNAWAAVENHCIVEIRQTAVNRPCLAVLIQESNQMYLNAWINRNMTNRQEASTDVSIGIDMGNGRKENYLVHYNDPRDAHALAGALHRTLAEAANAARREEEEQYSSQITRSSSLVAAPTRNPEDGPQTTKPIMQCRCKMFLQNEHASWTNLGNVGLRLSMQIPSQRIHVYIESEKDNKRLVNTFIQSNFVERVSGNNKRITFRLMNETTRATAVYMIQVKDDKIGVKIYDYLKGNRH